MSKITKWVDLHPRAERLLTDANVCNDAQSGIINQPADVQIKRIDEMYRRADADTSGLSTAVRAPLSNPRAIKRGEYVVLPKSAVNALDRVRSQLRIDHQPRLADRMEKVIMDGMDFFDVCAMWDEGGIMPTTIEFDAQAEADDRADIEAAEKKQRTPEQEKAHAIALAARRERARDKRAGVHPAPISWYVRKIRNGGTK